jgi:hypothetical protein
MTTPSPLEEDARRPEGALEHSSGASLFAQVEGLAGEEQDLLVIPAEERKAHQHERLRAIGDELDRIFARLDQRARRRGGKPAG